MMTFEIQVVSEANQREHWSKKSKRKKAQQHDFSILFKMQKRSVDVTLPATITFTRYALQMMDRDNLAGAFKHVQDALAKELKIDDGETDKVTWVYAQERISKNLHYFTVKFEQKGEL